MKLPKRKDARPKAEVKHMRTHEQYIKWALEVTNQEYDGDAKEFSEQLQAAYGGR